MAWGSDLIGPSPFLPSQLALVFLGRAAQLNWKRPRKAPSEIPCAVYLVEHSELLSVLPGIAVPCILRPVTETDGPGV